MVGLEQEISALRDRLTALEAVTPAAIGPVAVPVAPAWRPAEAALPAAELREGPEAPPRVETPAESPETAAASPPDPRSSVPRRPSMDLPDLEDLLGGRVLAWLGGAAVLTGLAFLMALAVSSGWIGEGARTAMAAVASMALIGAGVWLHERRGRTDAALAALSSGIAAMFAVATVASQVYELIPSGVALLVAVATGSLATWLAVRWESKGIAALGILGAMLAPLLSGAPLDPGSILVLFVAGVAAVAVLVHQGWRWLSFGVICVALPQWGAFLIDGRPTAQILAVLIGFGLLGGLAAVGHELRQRPEKLAATSAFLLVLNAFAVGYAGVVALDTAAGHTAATAFLWGLAGAHLLGGLAAARRRGLPHDLSLLLLTAGTLLGNAAFAATVDGPARTLGWAATAVGFAALAHRRRLPGRDTDLVTLGLGGHLALAILQVLTSDASPGLVGDGEAASLPATGALVALAAACFASSRLAAESRLRLRMALDCAGLVTVAYLTAVSLDGLSLVVAFAAEAAAVGVLAHRSEDRVAGWGAQANLGLALGVALALAPPDALGVGLDSPLEAAGALAAVVAAAALLAHIDVPRGTRPWLIGAAGVVALYLASVLLVTPFQPDGAASDAAVFELPVRQQGQVLLSALWALCGVAGIVVGLVRDVRALRLAAIALLLVAVAKVFLFDLATLTSLYRVASFVGLGVLLLIAAFVWQRVRPRELPDMRDAPDGIR